jgi:hypothetical protein
MPHYLNQIPKIKPLLLLLGLYIAPMAMLRLTCIFRTALPMNTDYSWMELTSPSNLNGRALT